MKHRNSTLSPRERIPIENQHVDKGSLLLHIMIDLTSNSSRFDIRAQISGLLLLLVTVHKTRPVHYPRIIKRV